MKRDRNEPNIGGIVWEERNSYKRKGGVREKTVVKC